VNMGQGIADENDNDVLGRSLEEGTEGALGLVSECLGLVKYDDLGRCLAIYKKEALHSAFDEGVDFLAHGLETALIRTI